MSNDDPAFVDGFVGQILRESTIHGVKYIGLPNRHIVERVFWTIVVLGLVGFSIYLVEDVYTKFFANPVIISFQPKETDISQVPFPAITICNVNILKRKEMKEIFSKLNETYIRYIENNETAARDMYVNSLILSEHLAHYCLAAPSFRRTLDQALVDSFGQMDFVEGIRTFLSEFVKDDVMNIEHDDMTEELRYNVTHFLDNAAHECEDMILKCMWARQEIPCKKLFYEIHTSHGSCCVFNMMPQYILRNIPYAILIMNSSSESDPRAVSEINMLGADDIEKWKEFGKNGTIVDLENEDEVQFPRHQHSGGKPYGLSILINPEVDKYGTCNTNDAWGFKMIAHSPISFPSIQDYGVAVPPDSEVFVDVEPTLSVANEKLESIDIEKRACYFPNDPQANLSSYKFYTASNCLDECIAETTYANCSCVRYFMPKNATQKLCGAKKLTCAEEVRENLTRSGRAGHCALCRPACTEIKYRMQLSHFPMREDNNITFMYNSSEGILKEASNYSIVHIYFGTDKVYAKERKRLYEAADLLANAGGLLSLTLGFSIVSMVEIIYFCTLRAWFYFRPDKKAQEKARKSPKPSAIVRPRIQDGLAGAKEKNMVGYYNWAMTTANATRVVVQPVDKPSEGVSRRKVSSFQFSSNRKDDPYYQYMN